MSDARTDILNRIRESLPGALLPEAAKEHPAADLPRAAGNLETFIAEAENLSATVIRVDSDTEATKAITALCDDRGWKQVLAWGWEHIGIESLPEAFEEAGIETVHDGSAEDLASIEVGITGCEAALAATGTIIVRSGKGRSKLTSLLPPVHIAIVDAHTLYPDLPSYLDSLEDPAQYVTRSSNLVLISGPSRTADIEQRLTLGVHGPRELFLVIR